MDERSERIARRFEIPMLIAAALVIPAIWIEGSDFSRPWPAIGATLDWLIWLAFACEMAVMLSVVPKKGEWLRKHPLEVAIVLFTFPFLPGLFSALRIARLARLLRVLRLLAVFRSVRVARALFSSDGLKYSAIVATLVLFSCGAAYAHVEDRSAWDGMWWAVTTATTVGYGDISPATDSGRVIAMILMGVSIAFVSILTGAFAERFVVHRQDEDVRPREPAGGGEEGPRLAIAEIRERLDQLEASLPAGRVPRGTG